MEGQLGRYVRMKLNKLKVATLLKVIQKRLTTF